MSESEHFALWEQEIKPSGWRMFGRALIHGLGPVGAMFGSIMPVWSEQR